MYTANVAGKPTLTLLLAKYILSVVLSWLLHLVHGHLPVLSAMLFCEQDAHSRDRQRKQAVHVLLGLRT